jgi:glycosyltransferase involved in cell wall biosynthesis
VGSSSDHKIPTISVIVATKRRASFLERLVDAVLSDPGALELIIVIDGIDDFESVNVLSKLGDRNGRLIYFRAPTSSQFIKLQRGVAAARGEVVLLLDDDVLPTCDLATGHARRHGARDDLVVVGSMPISNDLRMRVASRIYSESYEEHCRAILASEVAVLDYLWSGNVSLRRDRCLDVGVFSPSFVAHYHADRDFGYRLSDAGLVGVFDPSLSAIHLHSRSPVAFLRDARAQGEGFELLHRLHFDRLGPFTLRKLNNTLPYPGYLILQTVSLTRTSVAASWVFMTIGVLAGKLHLHSVETVLLKMAQHLAQLHDINGDPSLWSEQSEVGEPGVRSLDGPTLPEAAALPVVPAQSDVVFPAIEDVLVMVPVLPTTARA